MVIPTKSDKELLKFSQQFLSFSTLLATKIECIISCQETYTQILPVMLICGHL